MQINIKKAVARHHSDYLMQFKDSLQDLHQEYRQVEKEYQRVVRTVDDQRKLKLIERDLNRQRCADKDKEASEKYLVYVAQKQKWGEIASDYRFYTKQI